MDGYGCPGCGAPIRTMVALTACKSCNNLRLPDFFLRQIQEYSMESYFLLYDQPLIAPALASEVLSIFPSSKVTDQPKQGCQFSRLKSFAFCFCRLRQIKDNK